MKFQLTFVILAACSILRGFLCIVMEGPSDDTVLYGTDHELNCKTGEEDGPAWREIIGENPVQIFILYERESGDEKYKNFNISGTIPVYNLKVESIEIEDEGVYECATNFVDGKKATLSVEVPPSNVSITCTPSTNCARPNEEVVSEISCTCIAFGAYPETLVMSWTGATPTSTEPSNRTSDMGPEGSFDFTQMAEKRVTGTSGSVQCTLGNYVNEIEEADRTATYTYSSPICELIVAHDQTCSGGTANLTCSCDGDFPKVNRYIFFDGDGHFLDDGTEHNNVRYNVPTKSDGETIFYCRGCNGVNFGEESLSKMTICEPATTPTPTKTVKPSPTTESPNVLVIVLPCIGAVIVIGAGGFLVYCFCFKKREDEKENNDNTDGNGVNAKLAAEQPEYAAVNKPKSQPQAAPRSSQPPDNKEQVELQYADLDHGKQGAPKEVRKPADEPTEYATVQSVIV